MKKFDTTRESGIDFETRLKVRLNLETVIRERLHHPKVEIVGASIEDIVKRTSVDIEDSCYIASRDGSYYIYQSLVTEFMVHICPYFKTARHSMLFRDMLIGGNFRAASGNIPDSLNIAKLDKIELWPEIYDNRYFTPSQRREALELRDLEFGIAVNLVSQIETTPDIVFTPEKIGISQSQVCYGQTSSSWSDPEPSMNMKCLVDGTCEEAKVKSCMAYEDFLIHFASGSMKGKVSDPSDPKNVLSFEVTEGIRQTWNLELKMVRVYLDILSEMGLQ